MDCLKHLKFQKITAQNQVKGFSFNIDDLNWVILNGSLPQKKMKTVSTQTDPNDLLERPPSPSVFSKGSMQEMYKQFSFE